MLHLPFLESNPPTSRTAVSRLKCDQLIYLHNLPDIFLNITENSFLSAKKKKDKPLKLKETRTSLSALPYEDIIRRNIAYVFGVI